MKNNVFANGLLVFIGVLMLLAALQLFGWGRGTDSMEPEPFDPSTLTQLEVAEEDNLVKVSDKMVVQITDAPLFSDDRTPFVPPPEDPVVDPTTDPVEAEPLKAKVTSIIITDENSYAMVYDELSRERVTLKQGMPLPGDQGLWVVNQIKPRAVTFVADGEEPVELELEVFSGQLAGGGNKAITRDRKRNNRNKNNRNKNKDGADDKEAQKNSAEEIRRKIAERRAQMRANAAKGKKE
ncbi:hypothetical protein [Marinicella meishanensis]|uniref:hypothetical protein n=1 Tax=Marinicella meishanensis TaxID=2873263 RepID=UPI001CC037A5|nr:hypothetical protein [Marinicella sp. NBU2979]